MSAGVPTPASRATTLSRYWGQCVEGVRMNIGAAPKTMSIPQRRFVVLKCVYKVPALASCARCQRKFFTPKAYDRDPVGAVQYLIRKFDLHKCEEEPCSTKNPLLHFWVLLGAGAWRLRALLIFGFRKLFLLGSSASFPL